jgi:dienelactone hydrolase
MSYNPFARGSHPVGVRTITIDSPVGGNKLTVELWYPAAATYRGQDLDPAAQDRFITVPSLPAQAQAAVRDAATASGAFPLLLHSHGVYGYRRVTTTLCTHLASHGYVVAANDVPGNTITDLVHDAIAFNNGTPQTRADVVDTFRKRPREGALVIERVIGGADPEVAAIVDGEQVGAFGQSAGGWTTLFLSSVSRRVRATFAMEPAWGRRSPVTGLDTMASSLPLTGWGRSVSTFLLAGELDSIIMLQDLRELYEQLPAPKRFASLRGAGHWHFSDNAERDHEGFRSWYESGEFPAPYLDGHAFAKAMRPFSELCPAWHATDTMTGLCLAHMDAELKGVVGARTFLNSDLAATFAARGIDLEAGKPVHGDGVAASL